MNRLIRIFVAIARTASEPARLVPLAPYEVDDSKCLVGMHIHGGNIPEYAEKLARYEPSLTKNAHIMCAECQKACRYGRTGH